ncbi:phosphotransferase enzyme family protein [Brachybacterium kimchii]|uniref:Phosphotransferase n=1 Tax=Brachybacterium kimchii TaxID=2942909 RepID=A0ABY4NAM1_9MICO|nr:phosphotransferase [Brachybacterium kimchii]UQN31134.1 phosphotransferase [Brachybacterium kimchii]
MEETTTSLVDMLWEDEDPRSVIDSRFGFKSVEQAGRWIKETVRKQWELDIRSCNRIAISDRNALGWLNSPTEAFVAKWSIASDRFAHLNALARVVAWLGKEGVPISAPIPASNGQVQLEVDNVSLALQRKIDGTILDVGAPSQVRAAGATLAHVHEALAAYPESLQLPTLHPPRRTLTSMVRGWLDGDRSHVPTAARQALEKAIESGLDDALPTQMLHGDFRSTNILWSENGVSGVLDFDEARVGPRIDELARSAVLLGTEYRDWNPVSAEVRSTFLDGYASVSALTQAEVRWWPVLVLWYSVAMIPKSEESSSWSRAALAELCSSAWRD